MTVVLKIKSLSNTCQRKRQLGKILAANNSYEGARDSQRFIFLQEEDKKHAEKLKHSKLLN